MLMKKLLFLSLCLTCSLVTLAQDTSQHIIPGRQNSAEQENKPYVILISADGFRYDYAEKYNAEHLLAFAREGVKASSMIPSFPSVTYPNHYAIATMHCNGTSWHSTGTFFTTANAKHTITPATKLPRRMVHGITVRRFGYWPSSSTCLLPIFTG